MSFVTINPNRYDVDSPVSTDLFSDIVGDLNFLNGTNNSAVDAGGAPLILNGSFESPLVATSTTPDNWSYVAGTGATGVLVNTSQIHGAQSFKFTRDTTVGHTGGTLTSGTFFNVSPYLTYQIIFMLLSSRSDVSNTVVINWYAADQSALSSTTIYSSASAPTTWTDYRYLVTPPASALFGKIVISGGTSTTIPGGTASIYFDGISISLKPSFSVPTSYTSSTSFIAGSFGATPGPWKIKMWGKLSENSNGNSFGGGYLEAVVWMRNGDTATLTINNNLGSNSTFVLNGRDGITTLSCNNASTTASRGASGGALNLTGQSRSSISVALVEF